MFGMFPVRKIYSVWEIDFEGFNLGNFFASKVRLSKSF